MELRQGNHHVHGTSSGDSGCGCPGRRIPVAGGGGAVLQYAADGDGRILPVSTASLRSLAGDLSVPEPKRSVTGFSPKNGGRDGDGVETGIADPDGGRTGGAQATDGITMRGSGLYGGANGAVITAASSSTCSGVYSGSASGIGGLSSSSASTVGVLV